MSLSIAMFRSWIPYEREENNMAEAEVVIIGSGTCVPRPDRAGPATVVRLGGVTILVDSAAGTLRRLEENGIPWTSIDYLFYTHFHPDHVGELVPLIFATRYAPGFNRNGPIEVFGPEGLLELHRHMQAAFGQWVEPQSERIRLNEIPIGWGSRMQLPPMEVEAVHVAHTPQSLAYRFTGPTGRSVVVTGDTEPCAEVMELAKGADIVVVECSMPDGNPVPGHMTPKGVELLARESGAGKVVATHFYPDVEPQLEGGKGFLAAHDGMVVEV